VKPVYATVRRRLLAAFLDAVVLLVVTSVLASFAGDSNSPWAGIYYFALGTLFFNYFGFCEWRWGQTIGKNAVGIEVQADEGGRPGWSRSTIRNIFLLVDIPLMLLGVGVLFWWRSAKKKRIGDRIARTVVVRKGKQAAPSKAESAVKPATSPSRVGLAGGAWMPMHVAAGLAALVVLSVLEIALVAPFDPDLKSLAATLVAQLLLAVTLVGVAFAFATMPNRGLAPPAWLGLRPFKPSALKWALLAIGVYFAFALIYTPLVHPDQEDIARDLGFGESVFGGIAAGILIIGAAPISEEIFFRGFVFGGLRRRLPLWPAAAIAGVIFGVFHFTGISSLGVLPQLAVLGLLLCWLYEKTGSIWPPIIVHMLNNTLAFIVIVTS
jgi:CAAX protease family protein